MMERVRWFDDPEMVLTVGRFLVKTKLFRGEQLQRYYEVPWAFHDYWIEMELCDQLRPPSDPEMNEAFPF